MRLQQVLNYFKLRSYTKAKMSNSTRSEKLNKRHSILEQWMIPIGFFTWFLIGFALLGFDFYRLALVLVFTYFVIKMPVLQRFLSAWVLVCVLYIAVVAAVRLTPSVYRLALILPSQQARPFVIWFVSAAAVLTVVGVGVSKLERLGWPTLWLVAALLAMLLLATISLILMGVALGGIPLA